MDSLAEPPVLVANTDALGLPNLKAILALSNVGEAVLTSRVMVC